jgi:hypothetical protein
MGPQAAPAGQPEYPAAAAHIDYAVSDGAGAITVEVLDAAGSLVRGFSSSAAAPDAPAAWLGTSALSAKPGLNRLAWDMRTAGAWDTDQRRNARNGPLVPPGRYQVRLKSGSLVEIRPLEIRIDPRLAADGVAAADLQEQFEFNTKLVAAISRARRLGAKLRAGRDELMRRAAADPKHGTLLEQVRALEVRVITAGGSYPQPMLIDQLQSVLRMTSQADQRIGRDAVARFADLEKELAAAEAQFAPLEKQMDLGKR